MKKLIILVILKFLNVSIGIPVEPEITLTEPNAVAGRNLELWEKSGMVGNAEEQGPYFEGDIMTQDGRNGVVSSAQKWKNARIPYELGTSFSKENFQDILKGLKIEIVSAQSQKNTLSNALEEIMKNTCIKFIPHGGEKDFIAFEKASTGKIPS